MAGKRDDDATKDAEPANPFPPDVSMDSEPVEVGTDAPEYTEVERHGVVEEDTPAQSEAGSASESDGDDTSE